MVPSQIFVSMTHIRLVLQMSPVSTQHPSKSPGIYNKILKKTFAGGRGGEAVDTKAQFLPIFDRHHVPKFTETFTIADPLCLSKYQESHAVSHVGSYIQLRHF